MPTNPVALTAREYIAAAEGLLDAPGHQLNSVARLEILLQFSIAKSLARIADYMAPQNAVTAMTAVMPVTPDGRVSGAPAEHDMAICVLHGSHQTTARHTLIECPTYGPPATDPWAQATPVKEKE